MPSSGVLIFLMGLPASACGAGKPLLQRYLGVPLAGIALPDPANVAGWIFTDLGRQPWVLYGLTKTPAGSLPTCAWRW